MLDYLRYKWRLGMLAHILHRLSGIALMLYLVIHLWVTHYLSTDANGETFEYLMKFFSIPLFRLAEVGLLGVVLYHALNGLRIILIDTGRGVKYQKIIFWTLCMIGGIAFLYGAYRFLFPLLG